MCVESKGRMHLLRLGVPPRRAPPISLCARSLLSSKRFASLATSAASSSSSRDPPAWCITNAHNSQHLTAALQLGAFSDEDLDAAFARLDADADGQISRADLATLCSSWAQKNSLDETQVQQMVDRMLAKFAGVDADHIEQAEFKRSSLALGEQVHPVIYQLASCVFLMCVPFGIIVPYEPQLVASLGLTAASFGVAQGAMFVTKFLVNIPITDVVDRVGSRPILVGSTLVLGASLGGLSCVSCLEHLVLCRAIGGVAIAGLSASIQAPAILVQTTLNRARSSAPFTQAMNAGIALGPAIGGVLSGFVSMETAFAGVGCLYIGSAVACYRIYNEAAPAKGSSIGNPVQLFGMAFHSWYDVLRTSGDVRALCGISAVLWAAVSGTSMTVLPLLLYAEPYSFTASAIGALSAGLATLGIVVTQPLAMFADKFGRRPALGLGSAIMAGSMAAVPFTGTPAAISGALAAVALGQNLLAPAIGALMIDTVSKSNPGQITQAMSLLRSVQDVGMVSGAALIGYVGTEVSYLASYELSSSALLMAGLATYLRLPPPPVRAKAS